MLVFSPSFRTGGVKQCLDVAWIAFASRSRDPFCFPDREHAPNVLSHSSPTGQNSLRTSNAVAAVRSGMGCGGVREGGVFVLK